MTDWPFWIAALIAGFFGSTHCVGMCGGIVGVLTHVVRDPQSPSPLWLQLGFHLGRVSTYCLLAMLLGGASAGLSQSVTWLWWADAMRAFAALMLILMGLYLTRWWVGLTAIERWGAAAWRSIQPRFLQQASRTRQTMSSAVFGGLMWGMLPCGLVYSALITAAMQADIMKAGLFMLFFGLGTIPALFATSLLLKNSAQTLQQWRIPGGIILIAFGLFGLFTLVPGLFDHNTPNNQHEHHHHLGST